jgi:glycosyltransferase involved in cell wall biosynthesis
VNVSIIIPVRNGAGTLAACLEALTHQTQPPAEIIVVDDGSVDATVTVAHSFGVIVLSQKPRGPAAARNTGAAHATGDVLLFTDADCAPAPDWVAEMIAPLIDLNVTGVKGAYRTRQTGLVPRFVQQEYQAKHDRTAQLAAIDFIDTYSAAYRTDIFLAHGGFSTAFPTPSVEDHELAARLAAAGHTLVFNPRAVVYHQHDATLKDYVKRKLRMGYWKAWLVRQHPAVFWGDSHTPLSQRVQIVLWPLGVIMALAALGWPPLWPYAQLLFAFFYALSLSFLCTVAHRDPAVLLIAPLLLLARAVALGLGLLWGAVNSRRQEAGGRRQ